MAINLQGEEWLSLIQKLARLTSQGSLTWGEDEDAPASGMAFRVDLESGISYIVFPEDMDGRFPFVLVVAEDRSREVARFRTVSFAEGGPFDSEEEEASALLSNLYLNVARLVSGAPQLVQRLLADLDSLDRERPF